MVHQNDYGKPISLPEMKRVYLKRTMIQYCEKVYRVVLELMYRFGFTIAVKYSSLAALKTNRK